MKLTMLGTGNALVTDCYNTCFLLENHKKYFLIDGGGGNKIFSQLKNIGCDWMNVKNIFVTHKHLDHFMGIIWFVRMICQFMNHGDYKGDAYIYSHEKILNLIRDISGKLLLKKETRFIDDRLHLVKISDGEILKIIDKNFTFFDIQSTKAKQFGFCLEIEKNKKLTCCGDEPYTDKIKKYAENSDWLLHEAFCLYSEEKIFDPYEKNHSTVKDACEIAEKLHVKNLILYHTEDKNLKNREKLYKAEGLKYFSENLFIPNDLDSIEL